MSDFLSSRPQHLFLNRLKASRGGNGSEPSGEAQRILTINGEGELRGSTRTARALLLTLLHPTAA